ncbi:MAG: rod shape-determining protein MreC [Clostridia bacterium]|nr:rod shape-determining protein MreC [Clostridia bacterium]
MKGFFQSRTFIAICIVAALLLGMTVLDTASNGHLSFLENLAGNLVTPIQNFCTSVIRSGGNLIEAYTDYEALKQENEKLKNELASAGALIRDAEEYANENKSLKAMLGIAETHPDFEFAACMVVGNDQNGYSHTLTLNKGSADGLQKKDLVMTADGVVGYINELGMTWSKVTTVLDSSCEIGAIVTRTQDIGVLDWDYTLSEEGLLKLAYLDAGVVLTGGDAVETSGVGGVFPKGVLLGRVRELRTESHGISQYAVLEPAVDVDAVGTVFVITNFESEN